MNDERASGLPRRAAFFLSTVVLVAVAASAHTTAGLRPSTPGWATFLLLAACAALAQLFPVVTPRDQSYHTTIVFLIPAALLLPPPFLVLVAVAQHAPEQLRERYPWYIQLFNTANFTLNLLAASAVASLLRAHPLGPEAAHLPIAFVAAASVFVVLNHGLLASMLSLARGHSLRDSGLFSLESLSTELVLAALGISVAAFWKVSPLLIPVAIAPLVLIHRSLSVPALEEEARVDAKTGLFNARHFGEQLTTEVDRAIRTGGVCSLLMADLDLLRDVNNTYGHLAGDAVLLAVGDACRRELRRQDVPTRFGGEEFAILLPGTSADEALAIAHRLRRAVAEQPVTVAGIDEPVHATISVGVATFPTDASDATALLNRADVAVYRAKAEGRNRVVLSSPDHGDVPAPASVRLASVLASSRTSARPPVAATSAPALERASGTSDADQVRSGHVGAVVASVASVGAILGVAGALVGGAPEPVSLILALGVVAVTQLMSLELDGGSISVSAAGAIAASALLGPSAALPAALTAALVAWIARRGDVTELAFNAGTLCVATLGSSLAFQLTAWGTGTTGTAATAGAGLAAGAVYFAFNTGLLATAIGVDSGRRWVDVWTERFSWLLPHYLVFGGLASAMVLAYRSLGGYGLLAFAVPLALLQRTMAAALRHTRGNAEQLRAAAETISAQNTSLERANRLLRERSTAAMEALAATVDARDAYTAGHARRVQRVAVAIGAELGLSRAELETLAHSALFHDIGKLAIPDAILLKPSSLTEDEWGIMRGHAVAGARILEPLGFLDDAIPGIRHHHEGFDGSGYPDGLAGNEIPLYARIIHVADALDSIVTSRTYRAASPLEHALSEVEQGTGTQFCPRVARALDAVNGRGELRAAYTQAGDALPLAA